MSTEPRPALTALAIADPPELWSALGFVAVDGVAVVGGVRLELGVPGSGIAGWSISGLEGQGPVAGLATRREPTGAAPPGAPRADPHPNTAVAVDHVVIVTPDFDGMATALEADALSLRRVRRSGERRQGFRRLGPTIMEIVEAPEADGAAFWGVTVTVSDLGVAAQAMHGHLGPSRPAVQPGRRIATVARSAGLSTRLAIMDPEPPG